MTSLMTTQLYPLTFSKCSSVQNFQFQRIVHILILLVSLEFVDIGLQLIVCIAESN
jgi:hypothetical protein